jgi:hypothetical protein
MASTLGGSETCESSCSVRFSFAGLCKAITKSCLGKSKQLQIVVSRPLKRLSRIYRVSGTQTSRPDSRHSTSCKYKYPATIAASTDTMQQILPLPSRAHPSPLSEKQTPITISTRLAPANRSSPRSRAIDGDDEPERDQMPRRHSQPLRVQLARLEYRDVWLAHGFLFVPAGLGCYDLDGRVCAHAHQRGSLGWEFG